MKDQVVAEFDLRKEQPMLATRLFALCLSEKRSEAGHYGRNSLGLRPLGCRLAAEDARVLRTEEMHSSIAGNRSPPRACGSPASDAD